MLPEGQTGVEAAERAMPPRGPGEQDPFLLLDGRGEGRVRWLRQELGRAETFKNGLIDCRAVWGDRY